MRVKVADVDELPPGKGKTTSVAGREVLVFNDEGRFVATATGPPWRGALAVETSCHQAGHHFDTGHPAVSPDRLHAETLRYPVAVDDGQVFIVVEDVEDAPD
jgi:nitrite reductase/ring-hydroxylating ferredoxin subunit